jgi:hypothetical protein
MTACARVCAGSEAIRCWGKYVKKLVVICLLSVTVLSMPAYADLAQQAKGPTNTEQETDKKQERSDKTLTIKPVVASPQEPNKKAADQTEKSGQMGTEFWSPLSGYRLKITDTMLVAVTLLLFLATLALYFATKRLVQGTDETAKKQLRAYVGIPKIESVFEYADRANLSRVLYHAHVENFGQTPALKCRAQIVPVICPPQEVDTRNFEWPPEPEELLSRFTIFPRASAGSVEVAVSMDDLVRVFRDEIAYISHVRCEYVDIFEKSHTTATGLQMLVRINPREVLRDNIGHLIDWRVIGRYDYFD